jgi:uncharacterized membrane-anchored protein
MRTVPRIDSKYWTALAAASVFGTNTGDFVAGRMHLGHLAGLPYLLALFVAILGIERLTTRRSAVYFWAAIITMRTAATNVGDAFHDFGIDYGVSIPLVIGVFVVSVMFYRQAAVKASPSQGTVRVSPLYWWCMMVAGILGTIGGDFIAFRMGLTAPGAAIAVGLLFVASIGMFAKRGRLLDPVPYWLTVGLARTAGTAGGDSVAHALGLPVSTALTGFVFIALVAYFYASKGNRNAVPAS